MAAPTLVQSGESVIGNTASSRQVTLTVTTGNVLVLLATHYGGTVNYPASPVSDTLGLTWTEHVDILPWYPPWGDGCGLWTAPITSSGSNTITLSNTGMSDESYYMVAIELSGCDANFVDTTGTGTVENNTSVTIDLADTTYAEDIIFGLFMQHGSTAWSPGSGWSSLQDGLDTDSGVSCICIYRTTSSTGSYDPVATHTTASAGLGVGIAIKGVTAASSTALPRRAIDGPFYGSLRGSVR